LFIDENYVQLAPTFKPKILQHNQTAFANGKSLLRKPSRQVQDRLENLGAFGCSEVKRNGPQEIKSSLPDSETLVTSKGRHSFQSNDSPFQESPLFDLSDLNSDLD